MRGNLASPVLRGPWRGNAPGLPDLSAPIGKMTWRTDRPTEFSSCSRQDAGAYFRFLASIGGELSPIEQAVADGVPYTGEQPGDSLGTGAEPDDQEPAIAE